LLEKFYLMSMVGNSNNYCLYRHIKLNGETFYIGISSNLKRPYEKLKRSSLWKKIVNKYGYEVQIIKQNSSKEEIYELEKILISWYGRIDLKTGTLANMTDGGEGVLNKSIETKQKISIAQLGNKNHRWGIRGKLNPQFGKSRTVEDIQKMKANHPDFSGKNNPNYGKKHSDNTKIKISLAQKGVSIHGKLVLNKETGIFYKSCKEASTQHCINYSTLKSYLTGTKKNKTSLIYV